jgi:long-chain fatty acid transport protein
LTRRAAPAAVVCFVSLGFAGTCAAQVESALLSKISFNLTSAGGKSLAMGGAFTAIADDATAALANPAGLGLLSSVQLGISAKHFDETIGLVTARATASGGLTSDYPGVTSINSDISSSRSSAEFASVVLPVGSRFVAALTYAENLRFMGDPGSDGYGYVELRDNRSGGVTRRDFLYEYTELGAVDLRNRLLGLSGALRVSERLRIGAGVTLNRMTFDLEGDANGPHRIVSRTFLSPTDVDVRQETLAVRGFGGTTVGVLVGVHADLLPSGKLTLGAAYRSSGKTTGTLVLGGDVPQALTGREERPFSFAVPQDAALGLAAQPLPGLTIAAEGQWVDYADSVSLPLPVVSYSGLAGPAPGVPVNGALATLRKPKSVIVPRVGFEYVATSQDLKLAFRVGYHRESAHGVTADLQVSDSSGTKYDITDPPLSASVRKVFDGGKADDRFSGGLGVTWRGLSLDLAFDVGKTSRQLATSMFYRF